MLVAAFIISIVALVLAVITFLGISIPLFKKKKETK